MRVLVACALLAGCHASARAPAAAPRFAVVTVPTHAPDPPPASTLSFLERVSPHTIDVPHMQVFLQRREGPEAIDALLPALSERMTACYASVLWTTRYDHHVTMTIDAQNGKTNVDVEPGLATPELAKCLVRSLVDDRFDARHVVLSIDAKFWSTTAVFQPPP